MMGTLIRKHIQWCLWLAAAGPVLAGGGLAPAAREGESAAPRALAAPVQRAIVYRPNDTRETLMLQVVYHGPARGFCWMIPVPGRPNRGDVFLASEYFMDAVFERTSPLRQTELIDPAASAPGGAPGSDRARAAHPTPSLVKTCGRLETATYGVTVLAAKRQRRLSQWLERNGYAAPPDLDQLAESYAERDWRFVMLEVKPTADSDDMTLGSLRPVAIRFRTDEAVCPLALTQIGARERTAVEVVVIAPAPVVCTTLPWQDTPAQIRLGEGEHYQARFAVPDAGGLAREAVVRGPCAYSDLQFDALKWIRRGKPQWRNFWATRFFGVLAPEELVDLKFVADDDEHPFRTRILRTHTTAGRGLGVARSGWAGTAALVLILLGAGIALWVAGLSTDQGHGGGRVAARYCGRMLMYMVAVFLLRYATLALRGELHSLRGPRLFMSGQFSLPVAALWAAALAVWSLATLHFVVRGIRSGEGIATASWGVAAALWIPLMIVVVLAPSAEMREAGKLGFSVCTGVAQLAAMLTITALAALVAYLAAAAAFGPPRAQLLAAEMGLLVAAAVIAAPLTYVSAGETSSSAEAASAVSAEVRPAEALAIALGEMQQAIAEFVEDHHCHPASLADLTAQAPPAHGRDVGGNKVQLAKSAWGGGYLARIPPDPLSGSPETWLYDPLMPGAVASGAFDLEVSAPTQDAGVAPELTAYWRLPRPATLRETLGPAARMIWGSGDSLLRIDEPGADGVLVRVADVRLLRASVVKIGTAPGLESPLIAAPSEGTALILSCVVRRAREGAESDDAGGAGAADAYGGDRAALFLIVKAGHGIAPLSIPIEGRITDLVCSRDGVQVACLVAKDQDEASGRELWSLGLEGEWRGPLAQNVTRVRWHDSGAYLLALTYGDAEREKPPGERKHALVTVRLDGEIDTLARGLECSGRLLEASIKEAFVLDVEGRLRAVRLYGGKQRTLDTGRGEIVDVLHLGAQRVAALVAPTSSGEGGAGRLILFNRKRSQRRELRSVASEGFAWTDGRIIGLHDATGYFFLHLWPKNVALGQAVMMVGESGGPPQRIPIVTE